MARVERHESAVQLRFLQAVVSAVGSAQSREGHAEMMKLQHDLLASVNDACDDGQDVAANRRAWLSQLRQLGVKMG